MAARNQAEAYLQNFICPVCLGVLNVPVVLECGHNVCRTCIDRIWDSEKQPSCHECRVEFPARKCTENRLLANVIQMLRIQGQKRGGPDYGQKDNALLCMEHKKRLELFCESDETLVCSLCVPDHSGHNFLRVQKAVSIYKDKLKSATNALESKLKDITELQGEQEKFISDIQNKTKSLKQHIASEFVKLHHFLQDKEQQLIQQLKGEAAGILGKMEKKLHEIKAMAEDIKTTISDSHLKLQQEDSLLFLSGIKDETERIINRQEEKNDIVLASGDLSVGEYKGPLQYRIWKEMLSVLSPSLSHLALDPKTANCYLILSKDLTKVKIENKWKQIPDNKNRFDKCPSVLGSEGFISGRHYWEVEIGNKTQWTIGVTKVSSSRKGMIILSPENGYWTVWLRNRKEYEAHNSPWHVLSLSVKPQRLGVYLDYEGGQLSIYNADNMSHLYTFNDTFTERLYPYFCPGLNDWGENSEPLKLFQVKL